MSTYPMSLPEKSATADRLNGAALSLAVDATCPRCNSSDARVATIRFSDKIAALFGFKHFRCGRCYRRFRQWKTL